MLQIFPGEGTYNTPLYKHMQYLGGKSTIAKQLAAHLEPLVLPGGRMLDKFAGGFSVSAAIRARPLIASDLNQAVVTTMQCAQLGWRAPLRLTESEYAALKLRDDPRDPLTAFAAAGCSFGGKWWGGYARNNRGNDFVGAASRSIARKAKALVGVTICCEDYREREPAPEDCAYLDPPYRDSVGYLDAIDRAEFWRTARAWAIAGTAVRVSEYEAPDGWEIALQFGKIQRLGVSLAARKVGFDCLWKLRGAR